MTTPDDRRYVGYRYPAEVIATTVWRYFRFPLSLLMVEELLAARGITVSYETVRQWARKFGPEAGGGAAWTCARCSTASCLFWKRAANGAICPRICRRAAPAMTT